MVRMNPIPNATRQPEKMYGDAAGIVILRRISFSLKPYTSPVSNKVRFIPLTPSAVLIIIGKAQDINMRRYLNSSPKPKIIIRIG